MFSTPGNTPSMVYRCSNDRVATQRYLTPEIPIGSPVMSRTTSEPSDGRSRKMVANVLLLLPILCRAAFYCRIIAQLEVRPGRIS